jgi:GT2 family glycosyltransferase
MRQNSCVTAACLVLRKADYDALAGMKHVEFPVTFNDVDLCLRLGETGKEIVWAPQAELFHVESASRGTDELVEKAARAHRELSNMRAAWGKVLLADPSYNRNLNRDRAPYEGLAMPPFKKAGTAA